MQSKKILILRNYTLEPIFNELKLKFEKKNLKVLFDYSSYDAALPDLLKIKNSKLTEYDAVLIFFSIESMLLKDGNPTKSFSNYKLLILDTIKYLKNFGIKNIQLFFFFNKQLVKKSLNEGQIDKFFLNIKRSDNLQVFNMSNEINLFTSSKNIFDIRFWKSSMFPFNAHGINTISNVLYFKLLQIFKFKFKLLILDADNTLWNGIIDEVGYKKISFINKKKGVDYLKFQKKLKLLKKMGFLLSICSKNDQESLMKVFKYHKNKMILKFNDFILIRANWDPKYKNILDLHRKLNLSVENSFFIDDSEFEINSINSMIPKLECKNFFEFDNFHKNIDQILISKEFKITAEDKKRDKLYNQEFKRLNEREKQKNFKKYIEKLNIVLTIKKNFSKNFQRLAQLSQRTNQFNSTAIRYDEKEIQKIIKDPQKIIFQCSAKDKYGDYGIIGLAIIELKKNSAIISNFVMSCRALGREIENYFFKYFVGEIIKLNINNLFFLFKKNNKNRLVEQFLNENCKKNKKIGSYFFYKIINKKKDKNKNLMKVIYEK